MTPIKNYTFYVKRNIILFVKIVPKATPLNIDFQSSSRQPSQTYIYIPNLEIHPICNKPPPDHLLSYMFSKGNFQESVFFASSYDPLKHAVCATFLIRYIAENFAEGFKSIKFSQNILFKIKCNINSSLRLCLYYSLQGIFAQERRLDLPFQID